MAAAAYDAVRHEVATALPASLSGRELVDGGFGRDVEIAGAVGASSVVPVLREEAFGAAGQPR
jgi:2-phosphosulfolactate phosphatase